MSEQTKLNDIANQETGVNFRSPSVLTRAEQLPSGWDVADANSITDIKTGHTPSTDTDEYWNGNIPWIAIHDLSGLDSVEIDETEDNITEEGLASSGAKLVPDGALALCRTGSIGESAILNREMATDQSTVTFECYPDLSNPYFLMHIFQWCQPKLERLGIGSTHPSIQLDFFPDLQFLTPPLSEQRKIATVLHTVDQAIQKTEEIIEQKECIRDGFIQKALRYGVNNHSHFEETSSGKYPEEWRFVRFNEIIEDTRYGTNNKSNTEENGYPTLRIPNIVNKRITLEDLKHTPLDDKELERLKLNDGDILIIRTNGNPDYVGRCATFSERKEHFVYASYLIRLRLDESQAQPAFVREFLNSQRGRSEMSGWIRTSAGNYNLSVGSLEKFTIPIPTLDEQNKIMERTRKIDKSLRNQERYLNRLRRIKQGLMQDLLSGEVRTTDVDIDIPEEVAKYG